MLLKFQGANVLILVNGKVVLREHNAQNPTKMEIKQVCKAGTIFGLDWLDNGTSSLPQIWPIVGCIEADFIRVSKETFSEMWYCCQNDAKEVGLSMLQENLFFKQLQPQTQYTIIYEKGAVSWYEPGVKVLEMHTRSPWNLGT